MPRSKVAPPGARLPLLVLALALALGAVLIVRVHRAIVGAPHGIRTIVASPRAAPGHAHGHGHGED